mmetsp:Transcript_42818/g.100385  ORF Transcript_42818/g.100385 Transcript_42818/m.100385 type:complete len:465 (-) Transcript_42818:154-1548(-)
MGGLPKDEYKWSVWEGDELKLMCPDYDAGGKQPVIHLRNYKNQKEYIYNFSHGRCQALPADHYSGGEQLYIKAYSTLKACPCYISPAFEPFYGPCSTVTTTMVVPDREVVVVATTVTTTTTTSTGTTLKQLTPAPIQTKIPATVLTVAPKAPTAMATQVPLTVAPRAPPTIASKAPTAMTTQVPATLPPRSPTAMTTKAPPTIAPALKVPTAMTTKAPALVVPKASTATAAAATAATQLPPTLPLQCTHHRQRIKFVIATAIDDLGWEDIVRRLLAQVLNIDEGCASFAEILSDSTSPLKRRLYTCAKDKKKYCTGPVKFTADVGGLPEGSTPAQTEALLRDPGFVSSACAGQPAACGLQSVTAQALPDLVLSAVAANAASSSSSTTATTTTTTSEMPWGLPWWAWFLICCGMIILCLVCCGFPLAAASGTGSKSTASAAPVVTETAYEVVDEPDVSYASFVPI